MTELYRWQTECIEYFKKKNHSIIAEVCTGAGKTRCAIEILKYVLHIAPDSTILIIVPKNVILENWSKVLYKLGFGITDIGYYYGNSKSLGRITITNIQNVAKLDLTFFDMCIMDEIHNMGTIKLLKILSHKFKFSLGLSATINKQYKIMQHFNGIYCYKIKEALKDDILNKFELIDIGITLDNENRIKYDIITDKITKILSMNGGYNRIMENKAGIQAKMALQKAMTERKQLLSKYYKKIDAVKSLCKQFITKKIIVFNEYNEEARKYYWTLKDDKINSVIINSSIRKDICDKNLRKFENGDVNIILTTKVLDEGYDINKTEEGMVGIIAAGNSTDKQTIQRFGRILRKHSTHSILIQVYCKNTIEEKYAEKRSEIFKNLCIKYTRKLWF